MNVFAIIGISLAGTVAIFLVIALIAGRLSRGMQRRIEETFSPGQIIRSEPMAESFGQESKGLRQIRGSGGLVLTRDVLWFHQIGRKNELRIPVSSIQSLDTAKSFLTKTKFTSLLVVSWQGENGPERAAWLVADLVGWMDDLKAVTGLSSAVRG